MPSGFCIRLKGVSILHKLVCKQTLTTVNSKETYSTISPPFPRLSNTSIRSKYITVPAHDEKLVTGEKKTPFKYYRLTRETYVTYERWLLKLNRGNLSAWFLEFARHFSDLLAKMGYHSNQKPYVFKSIELVAYFGH